MPYTLKLFSMKYIRDTESQEKHVTPTHHQHLAIVDCRVYVIFFLAVGKV